MSPIPSLRRYERFSNVKLRAAGGHGGFSFKGVGMSWRRLKVERPEIHDEMITGLEAALRGLKENNEHT